MKSTRYPFCYISSVMNLHLIFQLESEEIKRRPCSENHDWLLLQSMAKEPGLHLFALSSFSYASFFCDSNEFQAWTVQNPSSLSPLFILGSKALSDTLEHLEI